MSKKPEIKFSWNGNSSIIAGRKGFGKELNRYCAETIDRYSFPYMPYRTGYMWKTKFIRAYDNRALLIYTSRYAKYQHNYPYNHNHPEQIHPLATDHWEQWAWSNHKLEMCNDINNYRKKLSKP